MASILYQGSCRQLNSIGYIKQEVNRTFLINHNIRIKFVINNDLNETVLLLSNTHKRKKNRSEEDIFNWYEKIIKIFKVRISIFL